LKEAPLNGFKSVLIQLVVIVAFFSATPAFAEDAGGVTVKLRPDSIAVPLHQPLGVVLIIHNSSTQVADVDLGDDRKGDITLTSTRPDGTEQAHHVAEREGLARIGHVEIQPGQTYSQPLLLNDWLGVPPVGVYRIVIRLRGQINLHDGTAVKISPLPLVASIKQPDSEALTSFCRDALQRLLTSKTYSEAEQAAEELSYTEDPIAVPYLSQAFDTPYPLQSLLVTGLERIGTDGSIRVLLTMARERPQVAPEAIRRSLAKLANRTSDPDLEVQIRKALAGRM
jgi:hypothetical protein